MLELNHHFTHLSSVHFDDLDAMTMLHNARYAFHVERAVGAWYQSLGKTFELDVARNPDQFHVVRDFHIEFLSPFRGLGTMRIDLWVEKVGETSCVYGFLCSSEDGTIGHARGQRTIVKLDPASLRPKPWTSFFRETHRTIQRDLQAYA